MSSHEMSQDWSRQVRWEFTEDPVAAVGDSRYHFEEVFVVFVGAFVAFQLDGYILLPLVCWVRTDNIADKPSFSNDVADWAILFNAFDPSVTLRTPLNGITYFDSPTGIVRL